MDVIAVIIALNDELYENLSNGYAVQLGRHRLFHLSLKSASDIKPKYVKDDDVQVSSIKFIFDKDLIERFQTMYLECKVYEEEVKQKLAECFKTYSF